MLSFEFYTLNSLLPDVCTWFIYRSLDRSVIQAEEGLKAEEESYRKIFCPTASCFLHNYGCFKAKFACFKSTYLRVKWKMFVFCRDNLFDSVMIIFSVEFVVLCFQVRCFFLRVCVVFAAFTCLKTALGT